MARPGRAPLPRSSAAGDKCGGGDGQQHGEQQSPAPSAALGAEACARQQWGLYPLPDKGLRQHSFSRAPKAARQIGTSQRHGDCEARAAASLQPAHDAAEHEHEIGAPHGVELRRVRGEKWHVGAEEARE